MWHFKLTEYNTGKIGCIGSNPSEKKAHIARPSYASDCRYNESITGSASSHPSPARYLQVTISGSISARKSQLTQKTCTTVSAKSLKIWCVNRIRPHAAIQLGI